MRSRFWFFLLLLPLLATAGCSKLDKSSQYYYYFNDKVYLNERRDIVFILFEKGIPEAQKLAIVQSDATLKPWTYHARLGPDVTYDGSIGDIAVLQSSGRIHPSKINAIRNKDGVRTASYMFEKDGHFSAVDDTFTVKLNYAVEESKLEEMVRRYGCTYEPWLTDGDPWEGVYTVTVPKTSNYGTVQLSCFFQESGLFAWTSPNFYVFGAFDV